MSRLLFFAHCILPLTSATKKKKSLVIAWNCFGAKIASYFLCIGNNIQRTGKTIQAAGMANQHDKR
jgi:hypothetical protein